MSTTFLKKIEKNLKMPQILILCGFPGKKITLNTLLVGKITRK